MRIGLFLLVSSICAIEAHSAEPAVKLPAGIVLEQSPTDASARKIVLIAGSNFFKPGEHEYIAGCALLHDLLKQTAGIAPMLAVDWPQKPETLANAAAIVLFADGAEKHTILKENRRAELQNLADRGAGITFLHQGVDISKELGDTMRGWTGAAWEKGYSQRAHWVHEFTAFPEHPIARGVTPFKIDDGYLYKLRFVPEMHGITPLLRTVNPKEANANLADPAAVVGWTLERPDQGRSFTFTGGHLHASFAEEGYRRFLVNGILWTAKQEIPTTGAPVKISASEIEAYTHQKQ